MPVAILAGTAAFVVPSGEESLLLMARLGLCFNFQAGVTAVAGDVAAVPS
jgi:hypothetical protein